METILSRFDIGRQDIVHPVRKKLIDGSALFRLSFEVFRGKGLSAPLRELIEGIIPEGSRLFLLSGGEYIYPEGFEPIPPEIILETINHDRACLFRRQVRGSQLTGEPGFHLCAVCLGADISGDEVAVGLVHPAERPVPAESEKRSYGLISLIKRFYSEFTSSKAVCSLVGRENAFRYVVKPATREIIVSQPPSKETTNIDIESLNSQVTENILPRLLAPETATGDQTKSDSRLRNLSISKCSILDTEYLLLSFIINGCPAVDIDESDTVIRNFFHKIKGQITTLRSAASRLALTKGKAADENDIASLSIIQSAAERIDTLAIRLNQYSQCVTSEFNTINVNQLIEGIVRRKKEYFDFTPRIELELDPEVTCINGDEKRIEQALDELLDNALEQCGETGKTVLKTAGNGEKTTLTLRNDIANEAHESFGKEPVNFAEPFVSPKASKAGLGLTIARRIFSSHGGEFSIHNEHDTEFSVTANLPAHRRK